MLQFVCVCERERAGEQTQTHSAHIPHTQAKVSVLPAPEGDACFRLTRASNASSVLFSDVRVKQQAKTAYITTTTETSNKRQQQRERVRGRKRKRERVNGCFSPPTALVRRENQSELCEVPRRLTHSHARTSKQADEKTKRNENKTTKRNAKRKTPTAQTTTPPPPPLTSAVAASSRARVLPLPQATITSQSPKRSHCWQQLNEVKEEEEEGETEEESQSQSNRCHRRCWSPAQKSIFFLPIFVRVSRTKRERRVGESNENQQKQKIQTQTLSANCERERDANALCTCTCKIVENRLSYNCNVIDKPKKNACCPAHPLRVLPFVNVCACV